ncbi:aspartic peptidase domain-containing protein [Pisolithus orientalis]|uniref:aspartic peptidase domain-containing protein n=1 Tax=Pisolithus orientalis TaxID=936130 RepID=UPI00222487D3|nr:aspartic peptidase domain-containing protein [Pisolithus orientalis]KAI6009533.1 aspartic peptidase domain-containing protein [Pisolithus orientalis]
MCPLSHLILFAALTVLVAALPHPSFVSIPLRRSSLTTVDGAFDIDKAISHLAFSESLRSLGPISDTPAVHPTRRDTGSIPLTDGNNVLWYGTISVVLPSSSCDSTCNGHTLYNPNTSSTAASLGQTFMLSYGDGSSVQGEQYTDTVVIAGYTATNQTFGAATQYSSNLQSPTFPADGLMGMGFKSLSIYGADPVIQTLIDNNVISDPVFAVKLASSGSELRLGGINSDLYSGSLTYTPVTQQGFWQFDGDAISANGNATLSSFTAIIDTGTTLILGDLDTIGPFYASLNATDLGNGFYTLDCDSMPSISITIGGTAFSLSSTTFNLGTYPTGSSQCVGAFTATGSLGNTLILGDAFLRNVYTVFDMGQSRVGFADLA